MTHDLSPFTPRLTPRGDHYIVSSLTIAEHFEREHKNVLQAIQRLDCSPEFSRLNFQPCSYRAANGRDETSFEITRDGFCFLAMGFTGPKAAKWKEAYIHAFNEMERHLAPPPSEPTARLGQVAELRLRRLTELVSAELLRQNPRRQKVLRYRRMGLSVREITRLLRVGHETIRREVHLLEACGLLDVSPVLEAQRVRSTRNLALAHAKQQQGNLL